MSSKRYTEEFKIEAVTRYSTVAGIQCGCADACLSRR
jgi:hypothetical protein